MAVVALVINAFAFLAVMVLVFRDLSERARQRQQGTPQVDTPLVVGPRFDPVKAFTIRRNYIIAFWLFVIATVFFGTLLGWGTLVFFLFLAYTTYQVTTLLGHDQISATLLGLVAVQPLASWIQYYAFSKRCRDAFGPLAGGKADKESPAG